MEFNFLPLTIFPLSCFFNDAVKLASRFYSASCLMRRKTNVHLEDFCAEATWVPSAQLSTHFCGLLSLWVLSLDIVCYEHTPRHRFLRMFTPSISKSLQNFTGNSMPSLSARQLTCILICIFFFASACFWREYKISLNLVRLGALQKRLDRLLDVEECVCVLWRKQMSPDVVSEDVTTLSLLVCAVLMSSVCGAKYGQFPPKKFCYYNR